MLMQIATGDWVDPQAVVAVAAYDRTETADTILTPHIVIYLSNKESIFHFYSEFAEAEAMRDKVGLALLQSATGIRRLPDVSARPV